MNPSVKIRRSLVRKRWSGSGFVCVLVHALCKWRWPWCMLLASIVAHAQFSARAELLGLSEGVIGTPLVTASHKARKSLERSRLDLARFFSNISYIHKTSQSTIQTWVTPRSKQPPRHALRCRQLHVFSVLTLFPASLS
jgi:hypothetical protein